MISSARVLFPDASERSFALLSVSAKRRVGILVEAGWTIDTADEMTDSKTSVCLYPCMPVTQTNSARTAVLENMGVHCTQSCPETSGVARDNSSSVNKYSALLRGNSVVRTGTSDQHSQPKPSIRVIGTSTPPLVETVDVSCLQLRAKATPLRFVPGGSRDVRTTEEEEPSLLPELQIW